MESAPQSPPQPSRTQRVLIGSNPRFTLLRIVILVALCFVTFKFILLPIRVSGVSMLPTYRENHVNLVYRLAYRRRPPQRYDVVAIRTSGLHTIFMKRIVALPSETIGFHQGRIYINGRILPEPYLKFPCDWERPEITLGPDDYYFVGDNRSMPWVDHTQGIAQRFRIVGKVML